MIMPLLTVKDVDASVAFYKDKLGFVHDMTMAPEGKSIFAIVRLGDQAVFGLGSDDAGTPQPFAPGVQFMIYLPEGQNIDDYYAALKAKGITLDDEPTDSYWGDRVFSLHDPDGYWLTFAVTIQQVPVEQMEASVRERAQQ
ncbi:MAG: hypothetical protein GC204_14635 [Chloroflexi bacterium]|nr:hypothetical protein [Chloroflexota bacterium]